MVINPSRTGSAHYLTPADRKSSKRRVNLNDLVEDAKDQEDLVAERSDAGSQPAESDYDFVVEPPGAAPITDRDDNDSLVAGVVDILAITSGHGE
ncbi:hypothetical protein PHLCEN_2v5696 [Hermanssonia centrifuga]|uniref:Uncharacterized protein n=1 Tax=Hermanssonia centrifuga TaxID=98765 RepID=A0A2R6P1Q6_9APHY|nr:hypothetical protein PHLCEN_2v5696 [Hermanssonia centrifuga]